MVGKSNEQYDAAVAGYTSVPQAEPEAQPQAQEGQGRVEAIEHAIKEIHWMARRYADGRMTYSTGALNRITRKLLALGVQFDIADDTPWARDGMGRMYDGLTAEEAAMGRPVDWIAEHEASVAERITQLEGELARVRGVLRDLHWRVTRDLQWHDEQPYLSLVQEALKQAKAEIAQAPTPHEGQEGRGENSRPGS